MRVLAEAPGKLVMAGEYAVLAGAPALVVALDRRARVEVTPSDDDFFRVDAPDLGIRGARAQLQDGCLHWHASCAGDVARLKLVTAVLESLADAAVVTTPWHMRLDTSAFFDADGQGKLGLGSSAALTVALTAALCAQTGHQAPDVPALLAMHRRMQGGRGSGLDIATSLSGGSIVYRLCEDRPQLRAVPWPQEVLWRVVWSGRPASTGDALATLSRWRQDHASDFSARMDELQALAGRVVTAVDAGNGAGMLQGMAAYAASLEALGQASGIDIVCAEHRRLAALAADSGVVYKTCGAGGGDVGVALTCDPDALNHFSRQVAAAGFRILDAGLDTRGLDVRMSETGNRRQAWTTFA